MMLFFLLMSCRWFRVEFWVTFEILWNRCFWWFLGDGICPTNMLEVTRGRWVWEFSNFNVQVRGALCPGRWCQVPFSSNCWFHVGSVPSGERSHTPTIGKDIHLPNCLCGGYVTPPKSNIDTTNDGLENVSPASNMASFWVSLLDFRGGTLYSSLLCHANFNCNRNDDPHYPPWNEHCPWKWMVGRWISFWDGPISGATEPWEDKDMMAKIARLIASRASVGWSWYA